MIVSAIANIQAINAQHRAGLAMMQANQSILGGVRQAGLGTTNFNALHQQDVKNDTDMAKTQFMYQVASAWKKHTEAQMKKEAKGVNYLA
jgi:hypothetical protein